jgi:hypothetical protein
MLTFDDSTNSKNHVLTLRSNTYTCLDLPEIDNDGFSLPASWLQLVPVVVARNSKLSPPSIHIIPPPTKPVQLHHQRWLCHLFSNSNFHFDHSYFPNTFHRSLRNRHNSLPYAASLLCHPSDAISQITHARPCGLQH